MGDGIISFLDQKEEKLLETLSKEYEDFSTPGAIWKQFNEFQDKASELVPIKMKVIVNNGIKKAAEWEVIQKVMKKTGQGFGVVQENTARLTLDKNKILKNLQTGSNQLVNYDDICKLRSYEIERVVINRRRLIDLPAACLGGAGTGFFGLSGVPFNLAFTSLMYYRTVQAIATFYGYDVIDDPRELEFASSVTLTCLSPTQETEAESMGALIAQMMFFGNLTALRESLIKNTYTEMAKKGGLDLLYVKIRALANKQAQKALANAGEKGIEAGIFKNLLEQLGRRMSKEAGKKAVPIFGAIIGGLMDTATMHKVIKGANLIYHKRFLCEKATRIKILNGGGNLETETLILDYDEMFNDDVKKDKDEKDEN